MIDLKFVLNGFRAILARILRRGEMNGPNVHVQQTSGVTILYVAGGLVRGGVISALIEQVAGLLSSRRRQRIVLDLKEVSIIDDTGVGTLVKAFVDARDHGMDLSLVCPAGEVLRVLQLTRLITVFRVYASQSQALASFD